MAKLSNDELIAAFKEMTLIELSDFVKLFEETFDVEAAAPAAVAVAAPAAPRERIRFFQLWQHPFARRTLMAVAGLVRHRVFVITAFSLGCPNCWSSRAIPWLKPLNMCW